MSGPRNLVVCLDGTNNEPEHGATNVARIYVPPAGMTASSCTTTPAWAPWACGRRSRQWARR